VAAVFIVVILLSSPSVWAFGTNPTLSAGQQYSLHLQGVTQKIGESEYTPPDKDMTVTFGRTDKGNLMIEFRWIHDSGDTALRDKYILLLAFDFNNNGLWEDSDHVLYTVDDSLALISLGYDLDVWIGKPFSPGEEWIAFYIPRGLYVFSYGNKDDPSSPKWDIGQPIGGPPPQGPGPISHKMWNGVTGPGPLYPDGSPLDFTPFYSTFEGTSYVTKMPVPLGLFHSLSGFGFVLGQQTVVSGEKPWLVWIWPPQGSPVNEDDWLGSLAAENGAQYLGNLDPNAEGPYNYVLADPPGPDAGAWPVGGFATAVDSITLVAPWIALTSIVGVALVVAVTLARRRKG
jgi:hypothetical protein